MTSPSHAAGSTASIYPIAPEPSSVIATAATDKTSAIVTKTLKPTDNFPLTSLRQQQLRITSSLAAFHAVRDIIDMYQLFFLTITLLGLGIANPPLILVGMALMVFSGIFSLVYTIAQSKRLHSDIKIYKAGLPPAKSATIELSTSSAVVPQVTVSSGEKQEA